MAVNLDFGKQKKDEKKRRLATFQVNQLPTKTVSGNQINSIQ